MKSIRKITSLFLAFLMVATLFVTPTFAATPTEITEGSIKLGADITPTDKKLSVGFVIPKGLSSVEAIQIKVDMPEGFVIQSIEKKLNDDWQIDFNAEHERILIHNNISGNKITTLEGSATPVGGVYALCDIVYSISNVQEGTVKDVFVTVEDVHANDDTNPGTVATPYKVAYCNHPTKTLKGYLAPTCKAAGYEGDQVCEACGVIAVKGVAIKKNPNNHVGTPSINLPAKAATCTTVGYTAGKKYDCCGAYYIAPKTIAKLGHSFGAYSVTKKATTSANGTLTRKCARTGCGIVENKTVYKIKTIKLSTTKYTYSGKAKKPSVTVKDSKGNKITSSNYTVSYASGRKNVGKYKVTIKFKGNYSGSKTLYFTINPKKTSLKSLTAGSKKLSVKWSKKSPQVTGYEIQYSTSSKFTSKTTKKTTVKSYKTTSKTIKKLKAKKKYYVRIRTYKTVKGKKYYSAWSSKKYKTTKK